MKIKTGNAFLVNQINKRVVFNLIWNSPGGISRSEVAKVSHLSKSTVSAIIKDLLREGYIHEIGAKKGNLGRRPILLKPNLKGPYTLAIDIDDSGKARAGCLNLQGDVLQEISFSIKGLNQEEVLETLLSKINFFLKNNQSHPFLGIAVGVPGILNFREGTIKYSANLGWRNFPLGEELKKRISVPIYLDNIAVLATLGEMWFGKAKGVKDFIYINCGAAIGAGIVIEGKIYRGNLGSAGEIGHMVVEEGGPLCSCGNRGCLEVVGSAKAIIKEAQKMGLKLPLDLEEALEEIKKEWQKGREDIACLLQRSFSYIGKGVANLVNILSPSVVILGGPLLKFNELLLTEVKQKVNERALYTLKGKVQIEESFLKRGNELLGGEALILNHLFGSIVL